MRIFFYLLIISGCLSLTSCLVTYGDNIARSYTRLNNDTSLVRLPPKPIAIFFSGEFVQFDYYKLGLVSVQGNPYSTNEDLLDHLKYEAYRNGANALIGVNYSYVDRATGQVFSDCPPNYYTATVCSGIAVKAANTSWLRSHTNPGDTLYARRAQESDSDASERADNQVIGSVLLTLLVTGVSIAVAASK